MLEATSTPTRDLGTWKKRPPNKLCSSSPTAKFTTFYLHYRSRRQFLAPCLPDPVICSLPPLRAGDVGTAAIRTCNTKQNKTLAAAAFLKGREQETAISAPLHGEVLVSGGSNNNSAADLFLPDKCSPILHCRSCTSYSECSDTFPCLADCFCSGSDNSRTSRTSRTSGQSEQLHTSNNNFRNDQHPATLSKTRPTHKRLVMWYIIQSVCKVYCVYNAVLCAACISGYTLVICVWNCSLNTHQNSTVCKLLLPSPNKEKNFNPGLSKKYAKSGVEPSSSCRAPTGNPLDQRSYENNENKDKYITTTKPSTSGSILPEHCSLSRVYTSTPPYYTLDVSSSATDPASPVTPVNLGCYDNSAAYSFIDTSTAQCCHGNGLHASTNRTRYSPLVAGREDSMAPRTYIYNTCKTRRQHVIRHSIFINIYDSETATVLNSGNAAPLLSDPELNLKVVFSNVASIKTYNFFSRAAYSDSISFSCYPSSLRVKHSDPKPKAVPNSGKTSPNGDNADSSTNKAKSASHNSRNSLISARRPLRGRLGNQSHEEDDEDDEKKRRNGGTEKIGTQCENSLVPNTGVTNSTLIGTQSLSNAALEMSLFQGAISRVWDVTRNLTLFGAQQTQKQRAPNNTIDLNLSICNGTANPPNLSELSINISHSQSPGSVLKPITLSTQCPDQVTEPLCSNQL